MVEQDDLKANVNIAKRVCCHLPSFGGHQIT